MATVSDVAREAGVSTATVSRALNNVESVDPVLARRVRDAAAKLEYRPNALARSLRQRRTSVWALIISDITNPFFTSVARGVEDVARSNGFSVLLCNADEDPEKERRYLEVVEEEHVAGVILSPHSATTSVRRLLDASIPLVTIDRQLDIPVDSVLVDSRFGSAAATRHLLDQGWTAPACITGQAGALTAIERYEGYAHAMTERALGKRIQVEWQEFRAEGGRVAAARLLSLPEPPDSFFVANTNLTLGVLAECRSRGIRVGQDIGLISFDDAPWAPFIDPPISVVAQPAYEIGARAAQRLVGRLRHESDEARHDDVLDTELIIRESSLRASPYSTV